MSTLLEALKQELSSGYEAEAYATDAPEHVESLCRGAAQLLDDSDALLELFLLEIRLRREHEPEQVTWRDYEFRLKALDRTELLDALRPHFPDAPEHVVATPQAMSDTLIKPSPAYVSSPQGGNSPLPEIPGFRLIKTLAEGGFGVVYLAEQARPKRLVAIKMIRKGRQDEVNQKRFEVEIQILAHIDHPNVVKVFQQGEANGQPYFVMEYINGQTLERCRPTHPSGKDDFEAIATLIVQLAQAMHNVHQQLVIHRDLKPGNILLDGKGVPKIIDFNLGRLTDRPSSLTAGDPAGTPGYMAPEQAGANEHKLTESVDVHGLGGVLYFLLTGKPPFDKPNVLEAMNAARTEIPPNPRHLNRAVPKSLDAICMMCLEKSPANRYPSAKNLADDLQRFRQDKAVIARPVTHLTRLLYWIRRNPLVTGLLISSFAAFLAGIAGYLLYMDSQRTGAKRAFDIGLVECERGFVGHGLLWMTKSLTMPAPSDDFEEMVRTQLHAWGRSHSYLERTFEHAGSINAVTMSRDGKLIATNGEKGVRLWDADSGKPLSFRPGTSFGHICFRPSERKEVLTWSNTGGALRLWNLDTNESRKLNGESTGPPVFTPDGNFVAYNNGVDVVLQNVSDGTVHRTFPRSIEIVDICANGRYLLTRSSDSKEACVWDIESGKVLTNGVVEKEQCKDVAEKERLWRFALSPDGEWWGYSTWSVVYLRRVSDPKATPRKIDFGKQVTSLAFSPDGQTFVTAVGPMGTASEVQLWDLASKLKLGGSIRTPVDVCTASFCHDGSALLLGSGKTASLWRISRYRPLVLGTSHVDGLASDSVVAAVHPIEGYIVTSSPQQPLVKWDSKTGQPDENYPVREQKPARDHAKTIVFSPDGHQVLLGMDTHFELVDAREGRSLFKTEHSDCRGMDMKLVGAFAPSMESVVTAVDCDRPPPPPHMEKQMKSQPFVAQRWDLNMSKKIGPPMASNGLVLGACFASGGSVLVTASKDGNLHFWDAATTKPLRQPIQNPGFQMNDYWPVSAVPGNTKRILTSWGLNRARFLNIDTGEPEGPVFSHEGEVNAVDIENEGRLAATGSADMTSRLWWVGTGQPVGPALRHSAAVGFSQFCLGERLVTTSWDQTTRVWDLPKPLPYSVERLILWAQVITRLEIDPVGQIRDLDPDTLAARRRQLERLGGPPKL